MRIFILFTLFFSLFYSPSYSQWLDGGRQQVNVLDGNGSLIVSEDVMYLWNGQNHFQTSNNNGLTWNDPSDSIGGANPHVRKMSASNGRVYAGLNFGTGNGVPIYSTDKGITWIADTLGAPGHALGWAGMPVVSDIYTWGHWLYVKWDQPRPYSIKSFGETFKFDSLMNEGINHPTSVISKGDTLFLAGNKIYFTTDGGATWIFPKNNGYTGISGKLFVEGIRLYMIAYKAFAQPCTLFYSDDNAENWTEVDISSLAKNKDLAGNYFYPSDYFIKGKNIWFAAGSVKFNTKPNIYKSTDFGVTWTNDTLGLETSFVNGVNCFAYTNDGYLWVSPSYHNIFKQKISDPSGVTQVTEPRHEIDISPNPCQEQVSVCLPIGVYDAFEVHDILGTIIIQGINISHLTSLQINMEKVTSGSYLIRFRSKSGKVSTSVIVKE
ncbi:MAG: T9SS type A sorting domain-containing protein [Ignavibacteria bacterium]|nr:T9SS type A sorting domain-containing protein [Ignavibacteria bacterium]